MKKITLLVAILATLGNSAAFAQSASELAIFGNSTSNMNNKNSNNKSSKNSKKEKEHFAWGIGLGALAVISVVVGLTAGCAASE